MTKKKEKSRIYIYIIIGCVILGLVIWGVLYFVNSKNKSNIPGDLSLNDLEQMVTKFNDKIVKHKEKITTLTKVIIPLDKKIKVLTDKKVVLEKHAITINNNIQKLEIKEDKLEEDISDLQTKKVKLQNIKATKSSVNSQLDNIQKNKSSIENQLKQLKKEKADLQKDRADLQKDKADLQKKLKDITTVKSNINNQLTKLQKDKADLQKDKADLQNSKDILKTKFDNLTTKKLSVDTQLTKLQKDKADLQKDQADLQNSKDILKTKFDNLTTKKLSVDTQLTKLQKDKADLQKDQADLQNSKDILKTKFDNLTTKKLSVDTQLTKLQKDKADLQKDQADLQNSKDILKTKFDNLTTKKLSVDTQLTQFKKDKADLQKDKADLQNSKDILKTKFDNLTTKKLSVDTQLTQFKKDKADLQKDKADLQNSKDILKTKFDNLTTKKLSVDTQLTKLLKDKADLQKDQADLQNSKDILKTKFDNLTTKKLSVDTQLTQFKKDKADLKTKISNLLNNIQQLKPLLKEVKLKVLTFNIEYGGTGVTKYTIGGSGGGNIKFNQLIKIIEEAQPDIISLQETHYRNKNSEYGSTNNTWDKNHKVGPEIIKQLQNPTQWQIPTFSDNNSFQILIKNDSNKISKIEEISKEYDWYKNFIVNSLFNKMNINGLKITLINGTTFLYFNNHLSWKPSSPPNKFDKFTAKSHVYKWQREASSSPGKGNYKRVVKDDGGNIIQIYYNGSGDGNHKYGGTIRSIYKNGSKLGGNINENDDKITVGSTVINKKNNNYTFLGTRWFETNKILEFINTERTNDPSIKYALLTGDLNEVSHLDNTNNDNLVISKLLAQNGFKDSYKQIYNTYKQNYLGFNGSTYISQNSARLDFIYYKSYDSTDQLVLDSIQLIGEENCKICDKIYKNFPSDHRALLATFIFNPNNKSINNISTSNICYSDNGIRKNFISLDGKCYQSRSCALIPNNCIGKGVQPFSMEIVNKMEKTGGTEPGCKEKSLGKVDNILECAKQCNDQNFNSFLFGRPGPNHKSCWCESCTTKQQVGANSVLDKYDITKTNTEYIPPYSGFTVETKPIDEWTNQRQGLLGYCDSSAAWNNSRTFKGCYDSCKKKGKPSFIFKTGVDFNKKSGCYCENNTIKECIKKQSTVYYNKPKWTKYDIIN